MSFEPAAAQPSNDVPVCPRHPDRVAYVRCQRCGRPACPQCQRTAAVGVQCVDCVRETARSAPVKRAMYGGAAVVGKPVLTYVLIGICVAAYGLQWLLPDGYVVNHFAYAPWLTLAEPWRMLTSAFLHSQGFILHIAFNMYALWIMGNVLEPVLGRVRYLSLYLLSAFGGSVGVLLLSPVTTWVLGASGAIFGLFGALFVIQRQRGGSVRQLVVLIAINAVLGFTIPHIAWQAHLGGLLTGAAAAAVIAHAPRGKHRGVLQTAGLVLVLVLLLGASAARLVFLYSL